MAFAAFTGTARSWPRAGACGRSAEAVAAARRLPCGTRSGGQPQNSLRSLRSLRSDSRGESDDDARCARNLQPSAPQGFPCPPSGTRPRPCVEAPSLRDDLEATAGGGFKAGTDGCPGAPAALSIAAQRGKSVVPDVPARRLHATARSATVRRHRSRPAEREAQGTRSEAEGAAAATGRPSAPALPRARETRERETPP